MPEPSESAETLLGLLEALPEDLYAQAFAHASWAEHRAESYERFAFLGDVVLSLAVSTDLLPRFERYGAGRLTKVRAQAVSGPACAEVAMDLGVPDRLRAVAPKGLGRSAEVLVESERVLASVCEAIIGAAYLAFGIERVAPAVVSAFAPAVRRPWTTPRTTSRCSRSGWPAGPSGSRTAPWRRAAHPTTARSPSWPRSTSARSGGARARPRKPPSRKPLPRRWRP